MAEESGQTESTVDKKAMKEVLSELLQNANHQKPVGQDVQPSSIGGSWSIYGARRNKAGGKSSKCNSFNSHGSP